MEDSTKKYYFKEVEEAAKRSHDIMVRLYSMYGLPFDKDNDSILIRWSPYVENNKFSDDEIEEMALSDKSKWDAFIKKSTLLQSEIEPLLDSWDASLKTLPALYEIASEAEANRISLDFSSIKDDEKDLPPLVLTAEETYWALRLLTHEQIRKALSSQAPKIYSELINSFYKGKTIFVNTFSELDPKPLIGLRSLLLFALRERFPLSHFQDEILSGNIDNLLVDQTILDNLSIQDADTFIWAYSQEREPIENIETFNTILKTVPNILINVHNQVVNVAQTLFSSPFLSRTQKKRIESIYNEWRMTNHNYSADDGIIDLLNENDRSFFIWMSRIDNWILEVIHECMENPSTVKLLAVDNTKRKIPGNALRLQYPSRVARIVKDTVIQNCILENVFNYYGRYFENINGMTITEEEFIFLFGGTVDYPDGYGTPYFWNTDEKIFAGLIRLLYDNHPTKLEDKVLPVRDRESYMKSLNKDEKLKSSVSWSALKNGLGNDSLKPIEDVLQNIVRSVADVSLGMVDMTSKTNSKNKTED